MFLFLTLICFLNVNLLGFWKLKKIFIIFVNINCIQLSDLYTYIVNWYDNLRNVKYLKFAEPSISTVKLTIYVKIDISKQLRDELILPRI